MGVLTNHLAAEPLIVTQLQAQVAGFKAVLSATDLAAVEEQSQITPACHVLYGGDSQSAGTGRGEIQAIEQHWQLWIVVGSLKTAKTARQDAGGLITSTIEALAGWQPSADHGPLAFIPLGMEPAYRAGFAYFPLRFSTEIVVRGTSANSSR